MKLILSREYNPKMMNNGCLYTVPSSQFYDSRSKVQVRALDQESTPSALMPTTTSLVIKALVKSIKFSLTLEVFKKCDFRAFHRVSWLKWEHTSKRILKPVKTFFNVAQLFFKAASKSKVTCSMWQNKFGSWVWNPFFYLITVL